jgi:hypothetical protein
MKFTGGGGKGSWKTGEVGLLKKLILCSKTFDKRIKTTEIFIYPMGFQQLRGHRFSERREKKSKTT